MTDSKPTHPFHDIRSSELGRLDTNKVSIVREVYSHKYN